MLRARHRGGRAMHHGSGAEVDGEGGVSGGFCLPQPCLVSTYPASSLHLWPAVALHGSNPASLFRLLGNAVASSWHCSPQGIASPISAPCFHCTLSHPSPSPAHQHAGTQTHAPAPPYHSAFSTPRDNDTNAPTQKLYALPPRFCRYFLLLQIVIH